MNGEKMNKHIISKKEFDTLYLKQRLDKHTLYEFYKSNKQHAFLVGAVVNRIFPELDVEEIKCKTFKEMYELGFEDYPKQYAKIKRLSRKLVHAGAIKMTTKGKKVYYMYTDVGYVLI